MKTKSDVLICRQLIDCLGLHLWVVVTWSSSDHRVIIWTNQSPADVLRLYACVSVKLIYADRSDRKLSMPPDTKTANRSTAGDPPPSISMLPGQVMLNNGLYLRSFIQHIPYHGKMPLFIVIVLPLSAERGPHSANSAVVVLENVAKLKPVSK